MKAISSSVTVVSASASRSPVRISAIATAVENRIATIGVWRRGLTFVNTPGITPSVPMP